MPKRSSRLLIAEPPLVVLPTLAGLIGLNEAIFLQQLHYWILVSGKERDGHAWIYNTYDEWRAQLPFWSARTIRRIVGGLEEQGLVLSTTAYNDHKVDKTKWYTLDYAAVDRLLDRADHVAKLASPSGQDDRNDVAKLAASVPETTSETTQREDGPRTLDELLELERQQEERRRWIALGRKIEGGDTRRKA